MSNQRKKRSESEVIMTREQAKQNLIAIGVAEPTDEQVSNYLNQVNGETKKRKKEPMATRLKLTQQMVYRSNLMNCKPEI